MFHRTLFLGACVGWVGLASAPHVLAGEKSGDAPLPAVPAVVVSGDGAPDGEFLGAPTHIEGAADVMIEFDGNVPLPEDALVEPGPDGDVVVRPATGNPYFLGFVAGAHYPEDGVTIDPLLGDALAQMGTDLRPDPVVYGFVMFSKRMTAARLAQLEGLGVENLGFHPHYCVRAAIPVDAIALIANLDFVRWVGVARDWQKVHPALSNEFAKWPATEEVAVYINVFEDDRGPASTFEPLDAPELVDAGDGVRPGPAHEGAGTWTSNGWQQKKLEQLGVTPKEFVPAIDAFRADITFDTMQALTKLDFVQFVELEPVDELHHDESVPMIASDFVRGFLDGGDEHLALVGEIDSGVDVGHFMLNHVNGVGWDFSTNSTGAFTDNCAHGTHVAGTIFGLPPSGNAGLTGNAPGVGGAGNLRVRMVKYLDFVSSTGNCSGSSTSHASLYDVLKNDYNDGQTTSGPPHVVNNSWGSSSNGTPWVGSEANARTLDNYVFGNDQVYVFSAGNDGDQGNGSGTIGLPGVAKNALTVGSVVDFDDPASGEPGSLADTSSRGPCGDGRWKPNVVAPGRWIRSALAGTTNTYTDLSGTSMAAPHVTGVVAQLVDGEPTFKYNPAKTAAVLMATATQKDETVISTEGSLHLDEYGTGRVNATFAQYATNDSTYSSWSFSKSPSTWSFGDFTVPSGTNRIVVVMHYVEPPSSSGASKALKNDFNLYIDRTPVDTANGNTGEYTAQQSSVDNTEIRIIDNPISGSWRWKAWPQSASDTVKMSVVVRFVHDTPHANGTLTLSASDSYVQPNGDVDVTATFFNPDVVASAVYLETSATSTPTFVDTESTLLDGIVTDLSTNQTGGQNVMLGDITDGKSRSATWTLRWGSEGVHQFGVTSKSDNTEPETGSVSITVDGTDPTQATSLTSTTHSTNTWTNDTTISYGWNAASDALSGVSGYGVFTTTGGPSLPGTVQDIGAVTSYSETLSTSSSGWTFNLRSVDNAGNWDATAASTGPYLIDAIDPTAAANLGSSTHATGTWSNDASIGFKWNAATDAHSGLAGYDVAVSGSANPSPGNTMDIGAVTSYSTTLSSTSTGWYFALRSGDVAGNWDDTAPSVGPYLIDTIAPTSASNVVSTDHTAGVWSNDTSLGMKWNASSDAHSGLAGYDTVVDHSPGTVPSGSLDTGSGVTSKTFGTSSSASGWYFHIRPRDVASNWGGTVHAGPYLIDAVSPAGPTGLSSPSHTAGSWSSQTTVTVQWNAATDAHSGLAGYDTVFDQSPSTVPSGGLDAAASATSKSATLAPSANGYYFHVRARDTAGNWGNTQHFGPVLIDTAGPTGPTNLASTTHVVGALSNSLPFKATWTPASDAHSGLAGYATVLDENAGTVPNGALDLSAGSSGISTSFPTPTSTKQYWLHVRARDVAGNWGPAQHLGPFVIGICSNAASNSTYGAGKPGTNGVPLLVPQDDPKLGETSTVMITNAFPGSNPILILGVAPTSIPWDGGTLLASINLWIDIPVPIQANGTLPLVGTFPSDPATCGATLYHQLLVPDPGASGFYGLAMSPGLARTLGS